MIRVLLVHEIRLMCTVMAVVLNQEPDIEVVGLATNLDDALPLAGQSDIVLVRSTLPDESALYFTRTIVKSNPTAKVVIVGLAESEAAILPYIEAGASAYVLAEDSVEKLIDTIRSACRGEVRLSPEIATALITRVAELAELARAGGGTLFPPPDTPPDLTPREREVLELIAQSRTNPEIAERLNIELGTVKNHVHNILRKLNVSSRAEAGAYLSRISTG